MRKSVLCLISILVCCAAIGAASADVRVGIVTDGDVEFWNALQEAANTWADEHDIELDLRIATPPTAERQNELAKELVEAGVQALAISPVAPEEQADVLRALGETTPLVTVRRDVPEGNRRAFIARDESEAGKKLAQSVLHHVVPGLRIMVFCSNPEAPETQARIAAMEEVFEPSFTVIDGLTADHGDQMLAFANMEEVIGARPEIAAFVGFEPYHGPAMLRAVTEAGRERMVRIIGFGGGTDALKAAMEQGAVHALVMDDTAGWAECILDTLKTLALDEDKDAIPEDGKIAAPLRTVDTEFFMSIEEQMDELQVQVPWISEVAPGGP